MMSLALALVVALAFVVEAGLGFGATLITVSVGGLFAPIAEILPIYVPANLALSCWVAFADRRAIDRRVLTRGLAPWMLLGLPLGLLALDALDPRLLRRALGAFVAALAALELRRAARHGAAPTSPLAPGVARALLVLGGAIHGAFGTGGPLAVYVSSRSGLDKRAFRGTLAALWIVLNTALVVTYARQGTGGGLDLAASLALAPSVVVGALVGSRLHAVLPEAVFRRGVYALLAVVGLVLLLGPA
jgi:uncharacterized membrane protein YfcA